MFDLCLVGGAVAVQEECIVKVWRAHADCFGSAEWRALTRLLDAAEQAQAARLCFTADRMAYVLAHGLRRLALAHLLNLPRTGAAALRFGQDAAGRPFLLPGTTSRSARGWFFSHAHAREGVLFAACRDHPVGVDVEPIDHRAPDPGLLRRYLDWPQQSDLNWDSPSGFAQGWTALESFVKALGCGLPGLSRARPEVPRSARCEAPVHCAPLSLRHAGPNPLRLGSHALPQAEQNPAHQANGTRQPAGIRLRRHLRREALVLRPQAPPGCAAALAVRQGREAPPPRLDEHRLDADAALLGRLC